MIWTMVIVLMNNLGISTCADTYESALDPSEWGNWLLNWLQSIIG